MVIQWGAGERIKTSVYDFEVKGDSKTTFAKPEYLNQKKMLDVKGASGKYSSSKRVLYDLTIFILTKVQKGKYAGQAAGFVNRIIKILKTLQ